MNSKAICNIYLGLWCVYFLQGTLYEVGSTVSRLALVIQLLISAYSFYYAYQKTRLSVPLKILALLIVVWTIYGLVLIVFENGSPLAVKYKSEYLKNILISTLPIYTFYIYARNGVITEDLLRKWFFAFLAVAIASFYLNQDVMQLQENKEQITNNSSYFVLSLLPLLPIFWRKPVIQFVLLAVCMFFVVMGFKRGAIVSGAICSFLLIIQSFKTEENSNLRQRKKTNRKIFLRILATGAIIAVAVYFIENTLVTNDYFNERLDQTKYGDSSGRDWLYAYFWNTFLTSDALHFLFGYGANGTLTVFYNYAHNDWLEIAINNGLFTMIIYFAFWCSMIWMGVRAKKSSSSTLMLGMFVVITLLKSFFSMSYSDISPFASCALGYALANYQIKKKGK